MNTKTKSRFLGGKLYQYLVRKSRRKPSNEKKERHHKIGQVNAIPWGMSNYGKNRPAIIN